MFRERQGGELERGFASFGATVTALADREPRARSWQTVADSAHGPTRVHGTGSRHLHRLQSTLGARVGGPLQPRRAVRPRSATLFGRVKQKKLMFPRKEDVGGFLDEFACEIAEYDEGMRSIIYTHPETQRDDALHATNYGLLLAGRIVRGGTAIWMIVWPHVDRVMPALHRHS